MTPWSRVKGSLRGESKTFIVGERLGGSREDAWHGTDRNCWRIPRETGPNRPIRGRDRPRLLLRLWAAVRAKEERSSVFWASLPGKVNAEENRADSRANQRSWENQGQDHPPECTEIRCTTVFCHRKPGVGSTEAGVPPGGVLVQKSAFCRTAEMNQLQHKPNGGALAMERGLLVVSAEAQDNGPVLTLFAAIWQAFIDVVVATPFLRVLADFVNPPMLAPVSWHVAADSDRGFQHYREDY